MVRAGSVGRQHTDLNGIRVFEAAEAQFKTNNKDQKADNKTTTTVTRGQMSTFPQLLIYLPLQMILNPIALSQHRV